MDEIPKHIEKTIFNAVRHDLDPKSIVVFLKTGFAIVLGGSVSLFICGQFGLGITGFAQDFNQSVHHHMGSMGCAFVCGSLFALLPVLVLRGISRPMQFRTIVRKKWQASALWLGLMGGMLAYHGELGADFMQFAAWIVGAYVIYRYFGIAVDYLGVYFQRLRVQY